MPAVVTASLRPEEGPAAIVKAATPGLRVHHVPMLQQNRIQRDLGLRVPRLERSPCTGGHLALLLRQWVEQRHEGRAVYVNGGQRVADVVGASLLMLCLQPRRQHAEQRYNSRGGGRAGLWAVAVLPSQVLRNLLGEAAGVVQTGMYQLQATRPAKACLAANLVTDAEHLRSSAGSAGSSAGVGARRSASSRISAQPERGLSLS